MQLVHNKQISAEITSVFEVSIPGIERESRREDGRIRAADFRCVVRLMDESRRAIGEYARVNDIRPKLIYTRKDLGSPCESVSISLFFGAVTFSDSASLRLDKIPGLHLKLQDGVERMWSVPGGGRSFSMWLYQNQPKLANMELRELMRNLYRAHVDARTFLCGIKAVTPRAN